VAESQEGFEFTEDSDIQAVSWSDQALQQLETTADLLAQCLENDQRDLQRQRALIATAKSQVGELKRSLGRRV
jgi:hypothetical protein